jgi:hypothetical protein
MILIEFLLLVTCLSAYLAYYSTLKIEEASFSETSIKLYQTTRRHTSNIMLFTFILSTLLEFRLESSIVLKPLTFHITPSEYRRILY